MLCKKLIFWIVDEYQMMKLKKKGATEDGMVGKNHISLSFDVCEQSHDWFTNITYSEFHTAVKLIFLLLYIVKNNVVMFKVHHKEKKMHSFIKTFLSNVPYMISKFWESFYYVKI